VVTFESFIKARQISAAGKMELDKLVKAVRTKHRTPDKIREQAQSKIFRYISRRFQEPGSIAIAAGHQ